MPLVIPAQFIRNSEVVLALGNPADIGASLIAYMCERLNVPNLAGLDVLDFGCGTRFSDAILNRNLDIGSYTGIDVHVPLISFLRDAIVDERFQFAHLDAHNDMYNPGGIPMDAATTLDIGGRHFDLICMFSVITHQVPKDAATIFARLREHIRADGHLFFSAKTEPGLVEYREHNPSAPTALSIYSDAHIQRLLTAAGWRVVSVAEANPRDLPIVESYLCVPA